MMSHRSLFVFVGSAALVIGCGAGGTDDPDGAPAYMGPFNTAGAPNGVAGAQPVGGAGTTNNPVVNGQGGQNGVTPTGSGGSTPNGVAGAGSVNPVNPGGAGAGNNAAGSGGQVGAAGAGNGSGGFVSLPVNGGASAAFVCPDGPFGAPLAGMGNVQTVNVQGSSFLEGPVWVGSQDRLFFSDNASNPERIWQMAAPFTAPSIFMENSGSNGLAVDNEDQLLLADEAADRITRVSITSPPQQLEAFELTGQPTPNDLILRSDDNLYFTDPSRGFYRLSSGGELTGPITADNAPGGPRSPNGIVLSPDENTLYVGDVNSRFVASFRLLENGAVDMTSGERFVDTMNGTVDGMAVDCAGNLYVGTDNGVEVYSPAKMRIGIVPTGYSSNVTFGGPDRRTIFVTSRSDIKVVTLGVPGLPN